MDYSQDRWIFKSISDEKCIRHFWRDYQIAQNLKMYWNISPYEQET